MFEPYVGVTNIDSSKVVITASGAEVTLDKTDWTKSTITFANEGEYTIVIKDALYGGETTSTISTIDA